MVLAVYCALISRSYDDFPLPLSVCVLSDPHVRLHHMRSFWLRLCLCADMAPLAWHGMEYHGMERASLALRLAFGVDRRSAYVAQTTGWEFAFELMDGNTTGSVARRGRKRYSTKRGSMRWLYSLAPYLLSPYLSTLPHISIQEALPSFLLHSHVHAEIWVLLPCTGAYSFDDYFVHYITLYYYSTVL